MSKSSKNPDLIREGDLVEIVKPERFVRCGYDWNPDVAADYLIRYHEQDILEFLKSIGIEDERYMHIGLKWNPDNPKEPLRVPEEDRIKDDHKAMRRFFQGLGYLFCNSRGLGDKNRKIFTIPISEDVINQGPFRVCGYRYVVTGEYYSPWGGYSYEGEYDYEPGGLHDQQHHRIIELFVMKDGQNVPHAQWSGFWIEAKNLQKIDETERGNTYFKIRRR